MSAASFIMLGMDLPSNTLSCGSADAAQALAAPPPPYQLLQDENGLFLYDPAGECADVQVDMLDGRLHLRVEGASRGPGESNVLVVDPRDLTPARRWLTECVTACYVRGMDHEPELIGPLLARHLGSPAVGELRVREGVDPSLVVPDDAGRQDLSIDGEPVAAACAHQEVYHPDGRTVPYRRWALVAEEGAGTARLHVWTQDRGRPVPGTVGSADLPEGSSWRAALVQALQSEDGVLAGVPIPAGAHVLSRDASGALALTVRD